MRIIEKHRKYVAIKLEDFINALFKAYPNIEDEIMEMGSKDSNE